MSRCIEEYLKVAASENVLYKQIVDRTEINEQKENLSLLPKSSRMIVQIVTNKNSKSSLKTRLYMKHH